MRWNKCQVGYLTVDIRVITLCAIWHYLKPTDIENTFLDLLYNVYELYV